MKNKPILLGVNIDHVATLRQARKTLYPDPIQAAIAAEEAGADGITLHMREDLRHIQGRDVRLLKQILQTRMNLELAITEEMLTFAEEIIPEHICLVPEKRQELTTEGGLDVIRYSASISKAVARLSALGSEVSLFIDADPEQIKAAFDTGAKVIEIHTGCYAEAKDAQQRHQEYIRINLALAQALDLGLVVNAGHGLNYQNVKPIASLEGINELNIGHAIIARALFTGIKEAVLDMRKLLLEVQ